MEEFGEDATDKNHVVICRALLARYGLDSVKHLDDELCTQGLIQLALACNAENYLPEVIGRGGLPCKALNTSQSRNPY